MHLYLIRHGESVGNRKKLIFGASDHPLTEEGRKDARTTAEKVKHLNIARCYSSPLSRALETAQICFKDRNIPIITDDRLREQFMGDFEDGDFNDLMKRYPKEFGAMMSGWTVNPPVNGESFDQMYDRVSACVDSIIERDEDAAVVAHNGSLSIITAYLLKAGKPCTESFYLNHGCYSSIVIGSEYKKDIAFLEYFNK